MHSRLATLLLLVSIVQISTHGAMNTLDSAQIAAALVSSSSLTSLCTGLISTKLVKCVNTSKFTCEENAYRLEAAVSKLVLDAMIKLFPSDIGTFAQVNRGEKSKSGKDWENFKTTVSCKGGTKTKVLAMEMKQNIAKHPTVIKEMKRSNTTPEKDLEIPKPGLESKINNTPVPPGGTTFVVRVRIAKITDIGDIVKKGAEVALEKGLDPKKVEAKVKKETNGLSQVPESSSTIMADAQKQAQINAAAKSGNTPVTGGSTNQNPNLRKRFFPLIAGALSALPAITGLFGGGGGKKKGGGGIGGLLGGIFGGGKGIGGIFGGLASNLLGGILGGGVAKQGEEVQAE